MALAISSPVERFAVFKQITINTCPQNGTRKHFAKPVVELLLQMNFKNIRKHCDQNMKLTSLSYTISKL